MKIKEGKSALEQNLYRSFLLLSATLVLISLCFTLFFDISRQRKDMDKLISGTASYIAAIPDVAAMLENGYPDSTVTRDLDSLSSNIPDINVILISDKNGLRFYHTNRLKTGDSYVAGDEDAILSGSDPYITTGYGTHGMQRRAFHAVKNSGGEIVGFVMVSLFTATLSAQHRSLLFFYIIIFLIMMIVSISLTHTMFSLLRDSLLGYDPEELVNIYTRQDEVMNMIDEGLAATDLDGRILFANQKVSTILGRPANEPPLTHLMIQELFPQTAFDQVIKTGESVTHESISFAGRQLIVKEVPIHGRGKQAHRGVLIVLFDRTDLLRLSDELSGAHNMLDTLRAFNHEFLNKLPNGYDTTIGENGCELSGGERQRISIARAFLKNAPILLLDEATASLDVENETLIQASLSQLMKNKTVLLIAHRMRTVAGADQIIVLKNGHVAENGSPETLMEENGIFAHMSRLQTEAASWSIQ